MDFLLDTANLEELKKYVDIVPISGVTSNPSILKKEGNIDFFAHMKKIRQLIGRNKTLHVQVIASDYVGMLADAEAILKRIDRQVYVKIPVTQDGLRAIQELKRREINVTATAIYTKLQGHLAIAAGADYIAPYVNRMENMNIDANETISELVNAITRGESQTKLLAASFKNVGQVTTAIANGAHSATMGGEIFAQAFAMPAIDQAVTDFTKDWESQFGKNATIATLS